MNILSYDFVSTALGVETSPILSHSAVFFNPLLLFSPLGEALEKTIERG